MHREDLAERRKSECPEISDDVLSSTAGELAERVHQKRLELAASRGAGAHGAVSLLDFEVNLFLATV
jgi:hypothetical protein